MRGASHLDLPTACALALLGVISYTMPSGRIFVPVALGCLVWARLAEDPPRVSWLLPLLGPAMGAVWSVVSDGASVYWWAGPILGALALGWHYSPGTALRDRCVAGATVVFMSTWAVLTFPDFFYDVALLHHAGGDALFVGASPWTGLAVPDGSSTAQSGSAFTGYTYPLTPLLAFGGAAFAFGSYAVAGMASWLAWIVAAWRKPTTRPAAILLTASAATPVMVWGGWTEVMTLALLVWAGRMWSRPAVAGVLLGLALGSKQYMIVALPLLLTAGWRGDTATVRRARTALAVAAASAGAGLLWGADYIDATILVHAELIPRADAYTLAGAINVLGISVRPPALLSVVAGLLWATWRAQRVPLSSWPVLADELATLLAVVFAVSPVAHGNYWFLVWGLLLVGRLVPVPSPADASSPGDSRSQRDWAPPSAGPNRSRS